ncbi:MAG TPA: hypothetical protein VIJ79_02435 [Acidobacteriaceae bacterium]
MISPLLRRLVCAVALLGMVPPLAAIDWFPLGPYGGDARSFAADPHNPQHLYLGTATGWIYESEDGGAAWKRLSLVGKRDDLVIDHILVDPLDAKHLIVGAFFVDRDGGGLYESHDGGVTWYSQAQMRGQSVRSLAGDAGDSKIMVAGTLQGVYRTEDSGVHWTLISPEGSTEIHNVQSVAIDPVDPNVIYAGTWHLPWKTVDGGAHWTNIGVKQGLIDDSDVFSIVIDPENPQTVYASACSGIYKSVDAGKAFLKVQGIPNTARRTRKLAMDPQHLDTVYAGTTEGLYRTLTGGSIWSSMTGPELIINDVYIDPADDDHVLLATDRAGVLVSNDGGVSFEPSNTGFSARQVTSFAADPHRSSIVYVGVVNDKDAGGVFVSRDGGVRWKQESAALAGRDVFSLATTGDGTVLAGTGHGIFRLDDGLWAQSGALTAAPVEASVAPAASLKKTKPARASMKLVAQKKGAARKLAAKHRAVAVDPKPAANLDAVVYALVPDGDAIFAGTSQGLLKGPSDGSSWTNVASLKMPETRFVAARRGTVMVASLRRIEVSLDAGGRWQHVAPPESLTQISAIAVDELGNLWVGGREGAFYSTDNGLNWKTLNSLYVSQVTGIFFDAAGHRVLVTANNGTVAFAVHLPDYKVNFWDTGWDLRFVRPVGNHLIGATMYDGVVVQPVMVDSAMVGGK